MFNRRTRPIKTWAMLSIVGLFAAAPAMASACTTANYDKPYSLVGDDLDTVGHILGRLDKPADRVNVIISSPIWISAMAAKTSIDFAIDTLRFPAQLVTELSKADADNS